MKLRFFLAAGLCIAASAPAAAAVTVIGNSAARLCFEATESRSVSLQGLDHCNMALREDSLSGHDRVATHVNRGIIKLRAGSVDEAILDFDKAIALDPSEAEAYLNKGMALLKLQDREEQAIGLFDTALERKTRRPAIAYYGRGVAHELNGRVREAYLDYRQASLMDPTWRDPKAELARFSVRRQ